MAKFAVENHSESVAPNAAVWDGIEQEVKRKFCYMEKIKNPLLTTAEAAAYLGLKISYLHKLMMRHAIPYYKPMGKLCFFSQADLDHWLTCNRIASQKEIEQQAQQYLSTKRIEKK